MNNTPSSSSWALRSLDFGLNVLRVLLIVATALAMPLIALAATGTGTVTVAGTLDAPFAVDFDDARRVVVGGDTISYENFEIGRENASLAGAPSIEASIRVQDDDLDSRFILIGIASVWLAAAWVGLVSFRGIVGSARRGEWLAADNPRRLRRLGGAVLVTAAVGVIGQIALDSTLDTTLPFAVTIAGSTWLLVAVVGLAVLALAEPFAQAAQLREFDESAI